ncbi:pyruvate dehydrogenase phosphatase regulatory subunit, mitochondrial [Fopius arisanus]|uniref:Pyruvate dehydrogenase phosphatase regulatory subunit, mitochondrial n=4 Tax=Fopius arisanus TaxID=64838 RepID=A0A9R1U5B0_9HYME|nr:PREDICTED: pyruvate dehydrogenase phosphatase regulatory subunit, mitochondrial [Fopius arisanus]XP_011309074.1 PREDICTED: pyruvate dehydrogenase phosphatase regulatory subunit, mitochondrial [Fopius arisanus]
MNNLKEMWRSANHLERLSFPLGLVKSAREILRCQLRGVGSSSDPGLPEESQVVICGGGVMGAAVAYHLAVMGWGSRTIILESGRTGEGTTWHASGLVGAFKPSLAQVKLTQDSIALYKDLEEKGLPTGWKQCGSLSLARTRDRMTVFRRMKAQSVSRDIECHLVTPEEAQELCPLIQVDDLVGGIWIPGDGVADPYQTCLTLIKEAQRQGVQVFENCRITRVDTTDGRVDGVQTSKGTVKCQHFVNCAGFWARNVGKLSHPHVKVPLHPVEHYYLHTKPIPGLESMTPVVRDLDGYVYFRENNGRILAGGFEPLAKPAFEDGRIPETIAERVLPEDWDHFHVLLEQILHRVPALGDIELERLCNCPEAFSPDCKWIVGEAPEIRNYYVAAGMKTIGVSAAGGVGRATAELIINGSTSLDMYEIDVSRFLGLHNNRKFLRDRVREVPSTHYALQYPHMEFKTGRNLRMSPIYSKLKEAGAVFGQVMGYERPSWFQLDENDVDPLDGLQTYKIASTNTFGKPSWFGPVGREYAACRETIGLSDYSSFTKIDLWSKGEEVVNFLQYLCSNDVDVPVGSIIHTGMQNHRGGYENDCSLARISHNHYMMIAPTIQQTRCKHWIRRHLPGDGSVAFSDVTSAYTAICIMGPATRSLLTELTDDDLSPKSFPFFTFKELDVGLANGVRTMNLTHTGELGYVLYIPNEFALHIYTRLLEAGAKYGINHAGYYATRGLRVEKFYAFWGQDLDTFTTPLECGRSWRVKFDKDIDFIGRDALLRQREQGVTRKYVQLLLNDHDPEFDTWCWGGEPIYRNGKYCGMTTTTGYGYTFRTQVCLGFVQNLDDIGRTQEVTNEYVLSGDYEVDVAGIKFHAKCNLHSPNLPTKFPDTERDSYHATRDNLNA